jgi:hypothetical protein
VSHGGKNGMWVLTGERERFCCIHITGKSIRISRPRDILAGDRSTDIKLKLLRSIAEEMGPRGWRSGGTPFGVHKSPGAHVTRCTGALAPANWRARTWHDQAGRSL